VAELDGETRGVGVGDRVVVEPLLVCGRCPACRAGDYQICKGVEFLGVSRDGGFAEYVAVPRERVYPLPAELEFAVGGLAEPAAVCVHGVRLGGVASGDRVLVLGAGTIGLLSVMAARAAGAAEVAITARHAHQAEMAGRIGANRVFPVNREGARTLAEFSRDCPPDVVIETVGGGGATLNDAIRSVRAGGTVVLLGIFPSGPPCDALSLVVKEVRLVGSLTYGHRDQQADFELALQMMASNAPVVRDLVTHRFELERIREAFETAADKKRGAIKVVVTQ
jgi:threonine dehydrogenase-like Zn-dependent dehydrogenase